MISRYLLLVIVISLLPLAFFLTPDLFHTHDGVVHLARIAAYKKALTDGEFPVRWAGDLNYGYGMPLFNFIYQLPYLIASLFLFIGFGLVVSFKLTLALSFLLSGIGMFLFAKEFFEDEKKAFFIAIFYQFAPFRLIELLVRGSFGEVYAYAFAPFVLYFAVRLLHKKNYRDFILLSVSTGLLVISHNALSLLFFGVAVCFVLLFSKHIRQAVYILFALFYGLLLSAFYWVPALMEHKYTYGDLFMRNIYKSHFAPIQNFFIPNFFNSIQLQTGGISVQFGLFHLLGIILSIALLFQKKIRGNLKKLIILSLLLSLVSFFFMTPISAFVWERVSLLRQFQFPWRFLGLVAFASSLSAISYFSFDRFKQKWAYVVVLILVVITTAYYWKPPLGFDKINESYYWNYPLNTTYFGETDLIWSAGQAYSYPKERVEVISGAATVSNFSKKTIVHSFTVISNGESKLLDHTQYYPGWKVFVDGKEVPVEYQFQIYPGQLIYTIPSGKHNVRVIFTETRLRFLSDLLSLFSFSAIIFFLLAKSFLHEKK